MKKIVLISLSTPTFNNVRAASALPYHLIKGAKETGNATFEVYSFNINNIDNNSIANTESELSIKIHLLKKTRFIDWLFKFHLLFLRLLLQYPLYAYLNINKDVQEKIAHSNPDIIWIYGEELAKIAKLFPKHKCIVTMPDCEAMYYHRLLSKRFAANCLSKILRYAYAYSQYCRMENNFFSENVLYHFVGKADSEFYKGINPDANSVFFRHPLYAYDDTKIIKFHQPKIKLLFAGRYDFYCQHGSDRLLTAMMKSGFIKSNYAITFLGKGWEYWKEKLTNAGWEVQHILFAPDYIAELQKHDIQVNAIDVGTGTKGKVLDAISNGLLEIGTPLALENIAVTNNDSCIIYNDVAQAISVLEEIPHDINKYEEIAERGREQVINYHSRKTISKELFELN